MGNNQPPEIPVNQVMALFAGKAISFSLAAGATFADLADSLNHLGDRHGGVPSAVFLRIGTTGRPISCLQSGISE
ncbi:MAG: hypothetical protein QOD93_4846 [Acetobacteraceae bacterium]|jgi:hypothetical protein|nr:hypothetical protein [Acetobacteraceae bacterium]MEA2771884.1 hypothetical protein [Acetobacteraceae bacterium]